MNFFNEKNSTEIRMRSLKVDKKKYGEKFYTLLKARIDSKHNKNAVTGLSI
jgi:hypothetical protein